MFAAEGNPRLVTLPIVDGSDVWFTRPGAESTPSHTRVTRVVQDDVGFIWLGTPEGLRDVRAGDEVATEIEGVGRLVNTIVGDAAFFQGKAT